MFNWKHWRVTIDDVATEFDVTGEERAVLGGFIGVPETDFRHAVTRWAEASTAEHPRGWSRDEDTGTIEMWAMANDPGQIVGTLVFADRIEDFEGAVCDLSVLTAPGIDVSPVRVKLEPYFPELEKQAAVMPQANTITAFLDGLPDDIGIVRIIEKNGDEDEQLEHLYRGQIEMLLAEHFEINLKQVDVEKAALIDYLTHLNQTAKG